MSWIRRTTAGRGRVYLTLTTLPSLSAWPGRRHRPRRRRCIWPPPPSRPATPRPAPPALAGSRGSCWTTAGTSRSLHPAAWKTSYPARSARSTSTTMTRSPAATSIPPAGNGASCLTETRTGSRRWTCPARWAPRRKGSTTTARSSASTAIPATPRSPAPSCGFLLDHGRYVRLDYPGALSSQAQNINDRGQVSGEYQAADGTFHG
jgi:hypothetical protein